MRDRLAKLNQIGDDILERPVRTLFANDVFGGKPKQTGTVAYLDVIYIIYLNLDSATVKSQFDCYIQTEPKRSKTFFLANQ